MKQLQKGGSERQLIPPVTAAMIDYIPQYTTVDRETTPTTVTTRERTTYIIAPVCGACGEIQARVIGMLFQCLNAECPSNDPEGGASAIPLREEGKKLIDVKPIKEAA